MAGLGGWSRDIACSRLCLRRRPISVLGSAEGAAGERVSDFYDTKDGGDRQGNAQNIISYGGPGGTRLEFIPAYNWEVIVATPPWATASGPKGSAEGWGDWPAFLVKYRLLSANKDNGDYIVTAFFQMSDPLGTPGQISNNVLTAQPTLAFGKGWGDFDIQSTISVQIPVDSIASANFTAAHPMSRQTPLSKSCASA
jgi:hypothetical protein